MGCLHVSPSPADATGFPALSTPLLPTMFDSLRQAFREAVDNFRTELNRDAVPETADRLIRAMERELVEARLILERLDEQIAGTRQEVEAEAEALRACLRRETLARGIGDGETEEVARTFARRHLQRKDLLEEKLRVLERERVDRGEEVDGMLQELKGARVRREAMAASTGTTSARERLREADDLFGDLDRMAERIEDLGHQATAAEAMDGGAGAGGFSRRGDSPPSASELPDLDERLRILKERMQRGD